MGRCAKTPVTGLGGVVVVEWGPWDKAQAALDPDRRRSFLSPNSPPPVGSSVNKFGPPNLFKRPGRRPRGRGRARWSLAFLPAQSFDDFEPAIHFGLEHKGIELVFLLTQTFFDLWADLRAVQHPRQGSPRGLISLLKLPVFALGPLQL